MAFNKEHTDLKVKYSTWVGYLDAILNGDTSYRPRYDVLSNELLTWAGYEERNYSKNTNTILNKVKGMITIEISRGNKLIEGREKKKKSKDMALADLKEIRSSSDKHIYKALDRAMECYCDTVVESCIVINASGKLFGISIDTAKAVEIGENAEISNKKPTTITTGKVYLNGREYNILDLTKLSKVVG
jgi:hypothetical protein